MKLGSIEVAGIKRIVEDRKAVWERYPNRWVKYVDGKAMAGMSEPEMNDYLDEKICCELIRGDLVHKHRVWIHGDTINIVKNRKGKEWRA